MAAAKVYIVVVAIMAIVLAVVAPGVRGQSPAPAPAPAPSSDGTSIDQGIAYVLMFAALALTYLIHPMNATSFGLF